MPRRDMALDKWIEVAKARETELKNAVRRFVLEHCPRGDVVLFGSRARGDSHALSDWDIAVLEPAGEYTVRQEEFGQAVHLPLVALDELLERSMLILDIAHDGVLLCGRGDHWADLVRKARDYIREKKLIRTSHGWFPNTPNN